LQSFCNTFSNAVISNDSCLCIFGQNVATFLEIRISDSNFLQEGAISTFDNYPCFGANGHRPAVQHADIPPPESVVPH